MNETVAKVEELSDLWKPGAMDGTPPFVMNCSYLFHLFDFCCLAGAKFVVFLKHLPFLFPFFDDFE